MGCKDPSKWYADQIGKTFLIKPTYAISIEMNKEIPWEIAVVASDGFVNFVRKSDCRLVLEHVSHN